MKIAHNILIMRFLIITLNFFLFWNLSFHLLKELSPAPYLKIFSPLLLFYFLIGLFLQIKAPLWIFIFYSIPVFLLSAAIFINQKQQEQKFLLELYKFLPPLIAQMKLGLGFLDAYQQSLKNMENQELIRKLQDILYTLRFQKRFSHPKKEITEFVHHINQARRSSQPLKRLKQLHEKIKIEQLFHRKSSKVLMQLKLQSGILSFLYFSLLLWTVFFSGLKHFHLILLSFFFFFIGLVWIFKTGRKMKWSL